MEIAARDRMALAAARRFALAHPWADRAAMDERQMVFLRGGWKAAVSLNK